MKFLLRLKPCAVGSTNSFNFYNSLMKWELSSFHSWEEKVNLPKNYATEKGGLEFRMLLLGFVVAEILLF